MASRAEFINQQLYLVDQAHADGSCTKHFKMKTSPFVFFRGTAQIFYADLAAKNILMPDTFYDIPLTTIMGDCHTSNFGFFTEEGSHSEQIVFSLNDFDDACVAHAYWDILRYLVSLVLAADHGAGLATGRYKSDKDLSHKTFVDSEDVNKAMKSFLESYVLLLEQGLVRKPAEQHFLDGTFEDFATSSALSKRYKKAKSIALGGEMFLSKSAMAKSIDLTRFPLKFSNKKNKFTRNGLNEAHIKQQLAPYFYDHILDIVKRVNSGTGSANMDRYYLLVGPELVEDMSHIPACHIVEVKQQRKAAPLFYFDDLHHQNKLDAAHLTVKCQRRMQRKQDYCLDDTFFDGHHWLIRSRHHAKVGIDPEHITLGNANVQQGGFVIYAGACGQSLARAHCRGDRSSLHFETSMLAAVNQHHNQLIDIANDYATQVIEDYKWFSAAF